MEKNKSKLQTLIEVLTNNSKIHICIYDTSNILSNDIFHLQRKNSMHLSEICNHMKTTKQGLKRCMKCRSYVNQKVYNKKKMLIGKCINGFTEIVQPVIYAGKVLCIIYIGNLYTNINDVEKEIITASQKCDCFTDEALKLINNMQYCEDLNIYVQMSEIIKEYIIMLFEKYHISLSVNSHWMVEDLKNHISSYYNHNLVLSKLTASYNFNEKYIGRMFKKYTGMTFSEYINHVRIRKACTMIKTTNHKMIDIAIYVGYDNISYFNRIFKKITGMTPVEYRNSPMANIPKKIF